MLLGVKSKRLYSFTTHLMVWLYLLCWLSIYVDDVDGQKSNKAKKRKGRNKKKIRSETPFKGWGWVMGLFILCFIPPIISFFYNVYKDPMTPTLISNMLDVAKVSMIGFVSKNNKPSKRRE